MPFPQQPPSPEVTASPITQFFEGVGERLVDIVPEIAVGILVSNLSAPASTLYRARPGELDTNGAGERAINALNEVNPLYAAGVAVVDGTNAYERGDFVGIGKATLGLGVTVLMVAITLKGARTTRGPPKGASAVADGPKAVSKIDRTAFKLEREAFWKAEAQRNSGQYSVEDIEKLEKRKLRRGPTGTLWNCITSIAHQMAVSRK